MIAALALLAITTPPSALSAEVAFERDAHTIGQWSAFRKWADRDAVMFSPQAVWARDFLMSRKNPRKSISWRPALSFTSCDGRTAVNTGPWFLPSGKLAGYFTTIWQLSRANWKWVYDGGGPPKGPAPVGPPQLHRASCAGKAPGAPIPPPPPLTKKQARTTPEDNGRGQSADKTLGWDWKVAKSGERHLRVYSWNGQRYVIVLNNDIPAK